MPTSAANASVPAPSAPRPGGRPSSPKANAFPPDKLTMDHIIPVARGGTSTKGNVVPACFACNQSKAATTPAEQILDQLFPDEA